VLSQSQGVMKLRLGALGFTRRWGSNPAKQPVEVQISFSTTRSVSAVDGKPKTVRQVSVVMSPLGRISDMDIFTIRCTLLMRELRAYLLGS